MKPKRKVTFEQLVAALSAYYHFPAHVDELFDYVLEPLGMRRTGQAVFLYDRMDVSILLPQCRNSEGEFIAEALKRLAPFLGELVMGKPTVLTLSDSQDIFSVLCNLEAKVNSLERTVNVLRR